MSTEVTHNFTFITFVQKLWESFYMLIALSSITYGQLLDESLQIAKKCINFSVIQKDSTGTWTTFGTDLCKNIALP